MKLHWLSGILLGVTLLFMTACGSSTTSSTANSSTVPQDVTVKLSDFKIDSSLSSFAPGTTYRFVITNDGRTNHEFMIMPKAEGNMGGMDMSHMDGMALTALDDIKPGETKTLEYTFAASTAGSRPEFACYLPGHYEAGMKHDVSVK
ncbi:hypothetical protein EPA93_12125 [Ktedonosporobacter rubrisoli]|uniref:Blue (type 1) copper domain-containing protein n=1 Tax=Ktedonosporobacter rubrisoli TaxID=2509675 RepID=A0A4P6JNM3_KTERU|nr:hypothetical protein [Ktedonosporobacter rubrisoli]QBD76710.1 hypothetical protein EPA93_12125 [Ktedonosporobacter rubrisoli]